MYLINKHRKIYVLYSNKDLDYDFWFDLEDTDLEEAIEEYVRNNVDVFE